MARTLRAVFENGVLRPLDDLPLKNHQRVEVTVRPLGEWRREMERILKRRRKLSRAIEASQVEADVSRALQEVRRHRFSIAR